MGFPMSIVAPKARTHLSADALFHVVRSGFATIPDPRCDEADISLTDALMSAFALFSLKAPSLLAFDLSITHNFRELRERLKGQGVDNKKGAADNKL